MGEGLTAALFGFLGALALVGLLALGAAGGWMAHRAVLRWRRPEPERPDEAELRRMADQQRAWREVQNYCVERAYGMAEDTPPEQTEHWGNSL